MKFSPSMFEVSETCQHHCHTMLVAVADGLIIAYRAAWMYHCTDARLVRYLHAIREREERIRSHHRAFQIKSERLRFRNCLLQRIHARGLSATHAHKLPVFCQHD